MGLREVWMLCGTSLLMAFHAGVVLNAHEGLAIELISLSGKGAVKLGRGPACLQGCDKGVTWSRVLLAFLSSGWNRG